MALLDLNLKDLLKFMIIATLRTFEQNFNTVFSTFYEIVHHMQLGEILSFVDPSPVSRFIY